MRVPATGFEGYDCYLVITGFISGMTDWDARYRAGDTPWDKGMAAPPLIEILQKRGAGLFGDEEVLVPGCGSGYDVRALASEGLRVLGLDLADEALARAGALAEYSTERYEKGDFLDPAWGAGRRFSAIWEHTCFCAIDPGRRGDYARSAARLIKSGGHLVGVFFLTPQKAGQEDQGPPFNASIAEIDAYFGEDFTKVDSWMPSICYPGREGEEWTAIFQRK